MRDLYPWSESMIGWLMILAVFLIVLGTIYYFWLRGK